MSKFTTVKDKIPQKLSWPGFLASAKDSRTKVVLARKLEKQGFGSTPGTNGIGTYVDGTGFGTDNISTSMRVRTPSWSNLWGILGSLNELSRCNANASGNIFDGEGCLSLPQKLEPCQVSGLLTCELWVGKPDWTLEPARPEAFWLLPLLCVHLTSLHC